MKTPVSLAAALLAIALPLNAQRMGMANNDAPTCASSITLKDGTSIKVEYQANTWAAGKTMTAAADKEKGARARKSINSFAEQSPLGTLETSADITLGDTSVAAGKYALRFLIDEDTNWHLNLTPESKGEKIDIPLKLVDSKEEHKRVTIVVAAHESGKKANLCIDFGTKGCDFTVATGGAKKAATKDAGAEKTGEPGETKEGEKKKGDK